MSASQLTTYAFRNMVRVVAESTDTTLLSSWTDYRDQEDSDRRIVTYAVAGNEDRFMDKLGKLMELAGRNPQSHGLRMTFSGYVKCNCVLPQFVKFN